MMKSRFADGDMVFDRAANEPMASMPMDESYGSMMGGIMAETANIAYDALPSLEQAMQQVNVPYPSTSATRRRGSESRKEAESYYFAPDLQLSAGNESYGYYGRAGGRGRYYEGYERSAQQAQSLREIVSLFPNVSVPSSVPVDVESDWSDEVLALVESLLRRDAITTSDGGWKITTSTESFDTRWEKLSSRTRNTLLLSEERWAAQRENDADQTHVEYCDGVRRGTFTLGYLLGQTRAAVDGDLGRPPIPLPSNLLRSVEQTYGASCSAELEPIEAEGIASLLITYTSNMTKVRFRIDTERNVLLSIDTISEGKTTGRQRFSEFIEADGVWLPGLSEHENADGFIYNRTKYAYERLNETKFERAYGRQLSAQVRVASLDWPIPTLTEAKQAAAEGEAGFIERLILACRYMGSDENERAYEEWELARTILEAERKPGAFWLDQQFLLQTRQHEPMKQALLARADEYVAQFDSTEYDADRMFVVRMLRSNSERICGTDECLNLMRTLKPFYDAAPLHTGDRYGWISRVASLLDSSGQRLEALDEALRTAEEFPTNYSAQTTYVRMLVNLDRMEEADAFVRATCVPDREWEAYEAQNIYDQYISSLESRRRYDLLVPAFEDMFESYEQTNEYVYNRYVTALFYSGDDDKAYVTIETWILEGRVPQGESMPTVTRARFNAAVQHAVGNGQNMYTNEVRPRYYDILAETGLYFVKHEQEFHQASRIFDNYQFQRTTKWDEVLRELKQILRADMETMDASRISTFINWIPRSTVQKDALNYMRIEPRTERDLIATLRSRWDEAPITTEGASEDKVPTEQEIWSARQTIASPLIQLLSRTGENGPYLAFLKTQWDEAPEDNKDGCAETYFNALIQQPHTDAIQEEAYATLARLAEHQKNDPIVPEPLEEGDLSSAEPEILTSDYSSTRTVVQVQALHRLNDWVVAGRTSVLNAAIEEPEEMTRPDLAQLQKENREEAIRVLIVRLQEEQQRQEEPLHPWLEIEAVSFGAKLTDADIDALADICWERLGREPQLIDTTIPGEFFLKASFSSRCFASLQCLAVRQSADPQLAEDVLRYIELSMEGIETQIQEWTETREEAIAEAREEAGLDEEPVEDVVDEESGEPLPPLPSPAIYAWRQSKYQMLVALDRSEELEEILRVWAAEPQRPNPWRTPLAYLLAEKGDVETLTDAIALLQEVQADDELAASDYKALSNWHLALNNREAYEQARIDVYSKMNEWEIRSWLEQQYHRYNPDQYRDGTTPPDTLDDEILLAMRALMKKSDSPSNYSWIINNYYRSLRDFRILYPLGEAVLGRTSGSLYTSLNQLRDIVENIEEEATVDQLLERIDELRATATLDTDLRALDLLESIVEARAARLPDQGAPHANRAWESLLRAFEYDWSEHEPRYMAEFLRYYIDHAGQFTITTGDDNGDPDANTDTFQERAVELFALLWDETVPGSIDRLEVVSNWSSVLRRRLDREDEAFNLLESGINEYLTAHDGVVQSECYNHFSTYVSFLGDRGRFNRAETIILEQMELDETPGRTTWMKQQLYTIYRRAFERAGLVSFGSCETTTERTAFYDELLQRMETEITEALDANFQRHIITELRQVFQAAKRYEIASMAEDFVDFAFVQLPEVIQLQADNRADVYSDMAYYLNELVSTRYGLELLIFSVETEPSWMSQQNYWRGAWYQHGSRLGDYHHEYQPKEPELEERLFAITITALRRDLMSCESRNRTLYYNGNSHFWSEKAPDFLATANDVFEEQKDSRRHVIHISEYVYHGLDEYDRAIEMLFDAYNRKILDESGRFHLVSRLHNQSRYEESIEPLQGLIRDYPDNIDYRVHAMRAYFRTQKTEELLDLRERTHDEFHERNLWNEHTLSQMAYICEETQLSELAVDYFEELIPLHQRTQPNQGIGNGTLSVYYRRMALALSGLNRTDDAVEAACGAIVSWGFDYEQRAQDIETLNRILRDANDLDEYVTRLDAMVEETGQNNPSVRKALGRVYLDKNEPQKALTQIQAAILLPPVDPATYDMLIECQTALGDLEGVIEALHDATALSPRNLQYYHDLGERYEELENRVEAERARTSIIEALPNETEGHTMLGELRETQERWDDAILHWEQVAEIRRTEPTGLTRVGRAQLAAERWADLTDTIRRLRETKFEARFGDDALSQAETLLKDMTIRQEQIEREQEEQERSSDSARSVPLPPPYEPPTTSADAAARDRMRAVEAAALKEAEAARRAALLGAGM